MTKPTNQCQISTSPMWWNLTSIQNLILVLLTEDKVYYLIRSNLKKASYETERYLKRNSNISPILKSNFKDVLRTLTQNRNLPTASKAENIIKQTRRKYNTKLQAPAARTMDEHVNANCSQTYERWHNAFLSSPHWNKTRGTKYIIISSLFVSISMSWSNLPRTNLSTRMDRLSWFPDDHLACCKLAMSLPPSCVDSVL